MDNDSLCKRKNLFLARQESPAVSVFQKSGKTIAGKEKFQKPKTEILRQIV